MSANEANCQIPVHVHCGGSAIVTTAVGYAGKDPIVLLSVDAISAFNDGIHATATVTGDRLAVTVAGYTLTCQRDGAQANFPPSKPT